MSQKNKLAVGSIMVLLFLSASNAAEAKNARGGVLPPFAYIQFCVKHASACNDTKGTLDTVDGTRVKMTSGLKRQLAEVNSTVNSSISPKMRRRGDPWTMGGSFGDCNSYALTKREKLIAAGWPSGALSLTVVKTQWGEGHLILSVHTSAGVKVLDNLSHTVRPLSQIPYHLIAMQGTSSLEWNSAHKLGGTIAEKLRKVEPVISAASYRKPLTLYISSNGNLNAEESTKVASSPLTKEISYVNSPSRYG